MNPQLEDDLLAEGPPEAEFIPGISATFATKRVAAAALIRDADDRFLLVEPTYKSTWLPPGGVAEANEDPAAACVREVSEELGLDLALGPLLVVDWVPRHGVWGDSLQFIFDGGRMAAEQVGGSDRGLPTYLRYGREPRASHISSIDQSQLNRLTG